MSDDTQRQPPPPDEGFQIGSLPGRFARLPGWKRYAVLAAATMVLGGFALSFFETPPAGEPTTDVALNQSGEDQPSTPSTPPAGGTDRGHRPASGLPGAGGGLVPEGTRLPGGSDLTGWPQVPPGQPEPPGTGDPRSVPPAGATDGGDAYSLGFLKMGFSFFVGFSLGYALRKFLQIALFFAGAFFALMFVLQYAGFVEVQWNVIDNAFQSVVDNLGAQLTQARAFVTGALPQAGLAGLGLVAGYKRN